MICGSKRIPRGCASVVHAYCILTYYYYTYILYTVCILIGELVSHALSSHLTATGGGIVADGGGSGSTTNQPPGNLLPYTRLRHYIPI